MNKLKLLFAPLSIFLSHISRCLSIAKELKHKYDIQFIACSKYYDLIKDEGYKVILVASENEIKQSIFGAKESCQLKFNHSLHNHNYNFKNMIMDDLNAITYFKPDLVIFDGRITAHIAARFLNIPSIEIRNHVGILTKDEIDVLSNHNIPREFEFNMLDIENSFKEIMEAIRILPNINFISFLKNYTYPPVIIPGIEEFELAEGINLFAGREHKFVGPLDWSGWKKWNPDTKSFKNKKNILITLGSTFPVKKVVYTIIDSLRSDQFHIIINTGDNFSFSNDKNIPNNCEIHKYLNIKEVLNSVDIAIHHGGHGTAMLTIMAGKPSIVIPFNGDHLEISRIIAKLQLGVRIKKYPEDITKEDILQAIDQILNQNEYMKNAMQFSQHIKSKKNPALMAAEFIENQIVFK